MSKLFDDEIEDEIVLAEAVLFMCRTYCRMRGKDFSRNLMATEFNNHGKALRSTVAVKADSKTYADKHKHKKNSSKSKNKEDETNEEEEAYVIHYPTK